MKTEEINKWFFLNFCWGGLAKGKCFKADMAGRVFCLGVFIDCLFTEWFMPLYQGRIQEYLIWRVQIVHLGEP